MLRLRWPWPDVWSVGVKGHTVGGLMTRGFVTLTHGCRRKWSHLNTHSTLKHMASVLLQPCGELDLNQNNCLQSHDKQNGFFFFYDTNILGKKQLVKSAECIRTAITHLHNTEQTSPQREITSFHNSDSSEYRTTMKTYYMTRMSYHFTLSVTIMK